MAHKPNTTLVTAGCDRGVSFDFVNPPLVRGSTILHDGGHDDVPRDGHGVPAGAGGPERAELRAMGRVGVPALSALALRATPLGCGGTES